ncbi:MAG: glycosyltransferase family A protein [Alsobacter sp.]
MLSAHVSVLRATGPRLAFFSLVVCSVGRTEELKRLFESLRGQSFRSFEVILVDQNDDDRLDDLVSRFSDLTITHVHAARGLSHARNVGLDYTCGDIVAFPDDDCWYPPTLLAEVATLVRLRRGVDIVSGRTVDESGISSVSVFDSSAQPVSRSNFLRCGNSNTLFFRRDALARIGPFDTKLGVGAPTIFGSGEEADVILRALSLGMAIEYRPDLLVHHAQVDEVVTTKTLNRAYSYGAGFGALLRKHRFGWTYFLYRELRTTAGGLLALLRGDLAKARYKGLWFAGVLKGFVTWDDFRPGDGRPRTERTASRAACPRT